MSALLRPATPADVQAVMALQALAYGPALLEPATVMARRLASAAGRCWLAEDADGPCAYLLTHRTRLGHVTPLGGDFDAVAGADSLHLHDLAVAPRAAGRGLEMSIEMSEASRCLGGDEPRSEVGELESTMQQLVRICREQLE
ncbi:MAG: hypothetical protein MK041_13315, partial [Aquabacterium sp.]|nr:hypothetical protein [Aquabacterium sp.]